MNWKMWTVIVSLLAVAGCATTAAKSSIPDIPTMFHPPAPDLSPGLAGYLGVWEGTWIGYYGTLPARLTVFQIDTKSALVIYAWGDEQGYRPYGKAGFVRKEALVHPDGSIGWTSGDWTFRFKLSEDRTQITGQRIGRWSDSLMMKKIAEPT